MFGPTWARRVWAAIIAGVVTLFVCSFLTWWTAYEVGFLYPVGACDCSLWQALMVMNNPEMVVEWQNGTIKTLIAVHIAALAGALLAGIRWHRRPTDPDVADAGT